MALPRYRPPFGWMPRSPWWALVPAGSIVVVVFGIEAAPDSASALTWLALLAVPPLAAFALGWLLVCVVPARWLRIGIYATAGCLLATPAHRQWVGAGLVAALGLGFDLLFFWLETVPVALALAALAWVARQGDQVDAGEAGDRQRDP